jgi:hypothetical protein
VLAQGAGELKMRARSTLTLFILALAFSVDLLLLMSVAQAADITAPGLHRKAFTANENEIDKYWPTDPVLCDLVLEGEIEEGNAASLEQKFQTIAGEGSIFLRISCVYAAPAETCARQ